MANVVTASNIAKELEKSNYSYNMRNQFAKLYGGLNVLKQKQTQDLTYDYNEAVREAYASSVGSKAVIEGSTYGEGYKEQWLNENEDALLSAYESYYNNYQSGISDIQEAIGKQKENVLSYETDFEERLANMSEKSALYYQSLLQGYLPALYEQYQGSENNIFGTDEWSRYLYDVGDKAGELKSMDEWSRYLYDVGDKAGELKSMDDLQALMYTKNEQGQLELNQTGIDVIDQLLNQQAGVSGGYSFDRWLQEQAVDSSSAYKDLWDWSTSESEWSQLSRSGTFTNAAAFRAMTGMVSYDEAYTIAERFGGLSKEEVTGMFDTYTNYSDKIVQQIDAGNYDDAISSSISQLEEVQTLANKYGLSTEFTLADGTSASLNDAISDIEALRAGTITKAEIEAKYKSAVDEITTKGGIYGSAIGLGAGAAIAVATGGVGLIALAIGGLVGLAVGSLTAYSSTENKYGKTSKQSQAEQIKAQELTKLKDYSTKSKDLFKNATVLMSLYSAQMYDFRMSLSESERYRYDNEMTAGEQQEFYNSKTQSR